MCPTPWKISFGSRREASTSVRSGLANKKMKGQLRPYHCVCGGWHLTSMSPADLRRIRKQRRGQVAA